MKAGNTLITRVMFCAKCEANKMPQKGNLFLTIGRSRQKYEVRQATCNGKFGFTPHIIEKTHQKDGIITFAASCSIHGCESTMEYDEETGRYNVAILTATVHQLPVREWNALVNYTNDSDYWLG